MSTKNHFLTIAVSRRYGSHPAGGSTGAACRAASKADYDYLTLCAQAPQEECEVLLPGLIEKMKAEIQAIRQSGDLATTPDGISKKKKPIAAYMREHPEVTNKGLIVREAGVDKT